MRLRNLLFATLLAIGLSGAVAKPAVAIPSGPGASHQTHKRSDRPKTVHVKSYTKKNGTVVKAHNRATPRPKN
jgi:hypothetical protein